MLSSILSTTFYGSVFLDLLRIPRCTLRINDFIPRASDMSSRMMTQGGNRETLTKKGSSSLPGCFSKIS